MVGKRAEARVRLRRLCAGAAATMLVLVVCAPAAFACTGNTWLNWAYLTKRYATQSGFTNTNQAAARPGTKRWGCAELKQSDGRYLFADWYCATIYEQAATPYLGGSGVYSAAVAWNDWTQTQQIWGWRCYS